MLKISERLFLMAQNPKKKSTFINGIYANYGLVGSLLLEMAEEELILVKDNYLQINSKNKTDHPIYNEVLAWIKKSRKDRKVDYWIRYLAQKSKSLRWQVFASMEEQGLVKIHHLKFFGIPYRKIELKDKRERMEIIRDLKSRLFKPKELQNLDLALLGLVQVCYFQKQFGNSRSEIKAFKIRLKETLETEIKNSSSNLPIVEVQKAILRSVMVNSNPAVMGGV